jgi:hypothetical protein
MTRDFGTYIGPGVSGSRRGSHPPAPTDPGVTISRLFRIRNKRETRTAGSESGLGKRTDGNTDTAPQADSTKLEWFLPWISTCTEHRCFLADTCPRCAQVQIVSDWFNRRLYTHPDRCRRLVKAEPRHTRCLARLSTSHCDKLRPGHPVLTMQQKLTELLDAEIVDAGVSAKQPIIYAPTPIGRESSPRYSGCTNTCRPTRRRSTTSAAAA